MAKKEKIELTPEELEAKKARKKEKRGIFGKTFTRILAWMLAIVLVYAVTYMAFGKPDTVVTASGGSAQQQTTKPATKDDWDVGGSSSDSGDSSSDSAKKDDSSASGDKADASATGLQVSSKQEAADLINKMTAAAANGKAGYKYSKATDYSGDGMKLDSALIQKGVDALLGALPTPTSIKDVVAGFIGIGEKGAVYSKGSTVAKDSDGNELKDYESLKSSSITAEDIADFKVNGNKIQITLVDCADPLRDNGCSLSRFTNDFLNKEDVSEALANQDDVPASLNDSESSVSYAGTTIIAMIENDKLTALKCTFECNARVGIKVASFTIKGSGTAERVLNYSDFKY